MVTITVRPQPRRRKQFLMTAAGALAALAVATGIGSWRYTDHRSDSPPAAVASLPSASDETPATVPNTSTSTSTPKMIILVSSREQAAALTDYRTALAAHGDLDVEKPEHVLVVSSADEAVFAQWLLAEAGANIQVVDLRVP